MTMKTVSVAEAKARLSEFLALVEQGEVIIVTRHNRPVAELRAVPAVSRSPRPAGLCKGEFVVPDDFDDPLPDNVLDAFEGR